MSWDTKKSALVVEVVQQEGERLSQSEMPALRARREAAGMKSCEMIACDGVAIVPFWEETPESPRTQQARTFGPDGKPLSSTSLFQVWSMLTTDLANRADLPPALRSICAMVHDLLEKALSKVPPKAG